MARCSPGDKITCHIKNDKIVNTYEDKWQEKRIFDILSIYDEGYILYVPAFFYLCDSFEINESNYKKHNLSRKFIGGKGVYINEFKIVDVHSKLDGLCCSSCKYFYPMAEANQDNGSLVCWNCRKYKFYK